jgi:hypothetical protein
MTAYTPLLLARNRARRLSAKRQCVAEFATDAPGSLTSPDYLDKYRELIALIGYTPEQLAAEFSLPIRIRPLRWRIQ